MPRRISSAFKKNLGRAKWIVYRDLEVPSSGSVPLQEYYVSKVHASSVEAGRLERHN